MLIQGLDVSPIVLQQAEGILVKELNSRYKNKVGLYSKQFGFPLMIT